MQSESNEYQISANVVDILSREIVAARVHIRDEVIRAIEPSTESVTGFLMPGFVDSHIHIESSMLLPTEFARVAVQHGTVATVSDPHEIANVCGVAGIELMLRDASRTPFKFHFGAPSCVPATPFETSGATLDAQDVAKLLDDPHINHLAEMMNFPGVIAAQPDVMQKLAAAKSRGLPIDGHAPGVRGNEATQYFATGISTDHECVSLKEAHEKINLGCKIAIREGSAAKNFDALWPLIQSLPDACMFCSDDKHPDDLLRGHINQLAARAVANGCDVFDVLRVACVNPVEHYQLNVGQLRVGDPADFIVVDDLEDFRVRKTFLNGKPVMDDDVCLLPETEKESINNFDASPIDVESLQVVAKSSQMRVVEIHDGQLITGNSEATVEQGKPIPSCPGEDLLKLVVLNRYQPAAPVVAFARGSGLKQGAFASSVAHDSHNIVAMGVEDNDLAMAINCLVENQGGLSVAHNGSADVLQLPVAGLISPNSCQEVAEEYLRLDEKVKTLGCHLRAPFMTLSFLALPVIPSLKLTDKGLFDVASFGFVPLFK